MVDDQNLNERTSLLQNLSRISRSESRFNYESTSSRLNPRHQISKIKSLNKLNIRSPLLTPGGSNFILDHIISNGDQPSPSTFKTNQSVRSKALKTAHGALYSLRSYYDDFTTIDWAKAFTLANRFNYEIQHDEVNKLTGTDGEIIEKRHIPFYYKVYLLFSKWILIVMIALCFSLIAYCIDKSEIFLVGFKYGYCQTNWFANQISCCESSNNKSGLKLNIFKSGYVINSKTNDVCPNWISWSDYFGESYVLTIFPLDFGVYIVLTVLLASISCFITLQTKISRNDLKKKHFESNQPEENGGIDESTRMTMYTASGSGVPEVKTILSGFVIRRFLGTYTLFAKGIALIFAIASGMALGKEGPYVHLATAVGNVLTRFFKHINHNEFFKKQILSASALAGVALAFGSPLGGVMFILEEINNHLPSHHLFQIFICAIISTLFLKFLNPYGTGNTVLFELSYSSDWESLELIFFGILGISGGLFGAAFVKFMRFWSNTFRQYKFIKSHPMADVVIVAFLTGIATFANPYTKQDSTELILELATSCPVDLKSPLCPSSASEYASELLVLFTAFIIKVVLTFITFGLKVPSGIYIPSMVAGALFGRIFSMLVKWLSIIIFASDDLQVLHRFAKIGINIDSGIYAMIGAGSFMAGVTRMNITLVTILFELTTSYSYVLPISISIAVSNWMGSLLESCSLYEALLIANSYPFMSSETEPLIPDIKAADIIEESNLVGETNNFGVPLNDLRSNENALPDYSEYEVDKIHIEINSSYISSSELLDKLIVLADRNLLDGCVPLIKNGFFVGLIYFSELEFIIDRIKEFKLQYELMDEIYCKVINDENSVIDNSIQLKHHLSLVKKIEERNVDYFSYSGLDSSSNNIDINSILNKITNIVDFIDYSPVFLNKDSDLTMAHLLFDQIGIRVIVLLDGGKYYGVLHKKTFVDFCRREA